MSLTERVRQETKQAIGWVDGRPELMTYRELGRQAGIHHTVLLRFLHGRELSGHNLDKLVAWLSRRR